MWKEYPGAGRDGRAITAMGEGKMHKTSENARCSYALLLVINRLYVTWLNDAALEFGGRLVEPMPTKYVPTSCSGKDRFDSESAA